MNINDKKIFIYKNINKIQFHDEIIKYIEDNDIKYASNNNGFFVNISLIDDHIDNIFNILQYYINNNDENDQLDVKKKQLSLDNISFNNTNIKLDDKKYNIPLDQFTESEQQIIRHSKQYII